MVHQAENSRSKAWRQGRACGSWTTRLKARKQGAGGQQGELAQILLKAGQCEVSTQIKPQARAWLLPPHPISRARPLDALPQVTPLPRQQSWNPLQLGLAPCDVSSTLHFQLDPVLLPLPADASWELQDSAAICPRPAYTDTTLGHHSVPNPPVPSVSTLLPLNHTLSCFLCSLAKSGS